MTITVHETTPRLTQPSNKSRIRKSEIDLKQQHRPKLVGSDVKLSNPVEETSLGAITRERT